MHLIYSIGIDTYKNKVLLVNSTIEFKFHTIIRVE